MSHLIFGRLIAAWGTVEPFDVAALVVSLIGLVMIFGHGLMELFTRPRRDYPDWYDDGRPRW